jgi:hypothetical protein
VARIDSTHDLAALIRLQVASLGRMPGSAGAVTNRPSGRASAAPKKAAGDAPPDVASVVARRVHSIDPDDPDRHRKAFRVFLESVLLAEFGEHLINDAGFHQLVEEVQSQMAADPELARHMQSATARMFESREPSQRAKAGI